MTMIATFPRAAFRSCLATIAKACEKRNSIPILACVLIRADGERVTLTTSNLDIWATTSVHGATAPDGFAAAIDFHRFKDAERKAPASDSVMITVSGSSAVVAFGAFQMAIPAHDPADFPAFSRKGDALAEITMPAATLRRAIEATAFAMSTEETRYYLNGVFVHPAPEGGALRFVSTDGHRLAHHDVPGDFAGADWRAILPRPTVAMLHPILKAKGAAPEIRLSVGHTWARIASGETEILTKLIDGTYPDYGRVIPRSFEREAWIHATALGDAIKGILATITGKGLGVRLSYEPGSLSLSAGEEDGAAEITIPADYRGEAFDIGFNGRYLLDILGAANGGYLRLAMGDAGSPIRIDQGEGSETLFVLMPMRVGNWKRVKAPSIVPDAVPCEAVAVPETEPETITPREAATADASSAQDARAESPAESAASVDNSPVVAMAETGDGAAPAPVIELAAAREARAMVGSSPTSGQPPKRGRDGRATRSGTADAGASRRGGGNVVPMVARGGLPPVGPVPCHPPVGSMTGHPPLGSMSTVPPVEPVSAKRREAREEEAAKIREARALYVSRGAVVVSDKQSDAVAYLYRTREGHPAAAVFFGRQTKPARRYQYRSEAKREADVTEAFQARRAWLQARQGSTDERNAYRNHYQVGTILRTCWGYEQTNVDFYEVIKVAGQFVEVRALRCETVETAWCQGQAVPLPGDYAGPPLRRRAQERGVRIDSCRFATVAETLSVAGVQVVKPAHWTAYG